MSPEPCHRASSTSAFSNPPESTAGRNLFKPVLVRISDFSRARRKISGCGGNPDSASIIGRAKSSKVTIVDTGFPGKPKKYFLFGANTPGRADGASEVSKRAGAPALHEPHRSEEHTSELQS